MKARVWFFDDAMIYTSTVSADELFTSPWKIASGACSEWGLQSKVWHWQAKWYYEEDIAQVKVHLEELLLQFTNTGDPCFRRDALQGLAQVALYQGRLSDAMDIIQ
jgi:hypothetical protein